MTHPKIREIHSHFISLIRVTDNPSSFIYKRFLRYFIEKQLEHQHLSQNLCLSSDIGHLTNQIKEKFGATFKHQGTNHDRSAHSHLLGLRLVEPVQSIHLGFMEQHKKQQCQNKKRRRGQKKPRQDAKVEETSYSETAIKKEQVFQESQELSEEVMPRREITRSRVVEKQPTSSSQYTRKATQVIKKANNTKEIYMKYMQSVVKDTHETKAERLQNTIKALTQENKQLKIVHQYLIKELHALTNNQQKVVGLLNQSKNLSSSSVFSNKYPFKVAN